MVLCMQGLTATGGRMDNSKIVMLSGIYLILGMYSLSMNSSNNTNAVSVETSANAVQAEKLAKSGISLALEKMGANASLYNYSSESVPAEGGIIVFSADRPAGYSSSQSKITSIGSFHSSSVTITATFSYERGRWRILRVYYPPK